MATGMRFWLTATLTGVAIIAAWKLPPTPYVPREAPLKPAETMRAEAVNEEFRVTAEALRRVLWADSLAPLAVSTATDGVRENSPVTSAGRGGLAAKACMAALKLWKSFSRKTTMMTSGLNARPFTLRSSTSARVQ